MTKIIMNFNPESLKKLYIPPPASHKGQNGKLMVIGGSHLFHAASLWALTVASRIVDMVFYSSVVENNQIVHELKKEFRGGIVVPREQIEDYIAEADTVLIGPGMLRTDSEGIRPSASSCPEFIGGNQESGIMDLKEINKLEDEGVQSYFLTKYLLAKYPQKKWVIDAGALQMLEPEWLLPLHGNVILTPHPKELGMLIKKGDRKQTTRNLRQETSNTQQVTDVDEDLSLITYHLSQTYNCIVLLKGQEDIVCSPEQCVTVSGGNAGMTKGGTGDVLAGLVAAIACNNDLFLAATAGSFINKKAGERLFEKMSYYFNASDLAGEIPKIMKEYIPV